jgi:hypothetical protein
MMWAPSQVFTHRARGLLLAHPNYSAEDKREPALMGQEKIEAAYASAIAVGAQLSRMNIDFGTLAFRHWMATAASLTALALRRPAVVQPAGLGRETASRYATAASKVSTSVTQLAERGLEPISKRATKNAKRLGKAKRSGNGKHVRSAKRLER